MRTSRKDLPLNWREINAFGRGYYVLMFTAMVPWPIAVFFMLGIGNIFYGIAFQMALCVSFILYGKRCLRIYEENLSTYK